MQRIQGLPELPVQKDSDDTDKKDQIPATHPKIDYLSWAEFCAVSKVDKEPGSSWTHRPEIDTTQTKAVIEILREEPRSSWEFKSEARSLSNNEQVPTVPDMPGLSEPQAQSVAEVEPHRIRIRSEVLLKLLSEKTGCNTNTGPFRHRMTFLRPFKLFISFGKRLNDSLDELDKIHTNGALLVQALEVPHLILSRLMLHEYRPRSPIFCGPN